ncbi:MFS transporter [Streptomyces sp. NPDC055287]
MGDISPVRRWAATGVVCLSLFLLGLDLTVLNVAVPDLQHRLQPTMAQVQWIVDGYALVLGGTVLACGALTDRIGRRRSLMLGLALCGLTSLLGVTATSPDQVIAARCGMGAGAALMMPATLSTITALFHDPRPRRRAIALWAAVGSTGGLTGPVVGGWLVEHSSWRAGFWINLPVAAAAIVLTRWLVPESRARQPQRVDWPGAALSTGGLLALVWAIIEGPARGWTSPPILCGFTAAALLLCVFLIWQARSTAPMLPLALLRNRRISTATTALALMSFALFGALFVMTLYLQSILGYTPWQAGLHTLPLPAALATGAVTALILLGRWREPRCMALGLALVTTAFAVLAGTSTTSGYRRLLVFQVIAGFGAGIVATAGTESVMRTVPADRSGLGSAINDATRQIGATLGVAVQGSVLTTTLTSRLQTLSATAPADLAEAATDGRLTAAQAAGPPSGARHQLSTATRQAFIDGLTVTALTAAAVTLAATACVVLSQTWPTAGTRNRSGETQPSVAPPGLE